MSPSTDHLKKTATNTESYTNVTKDRHGEYGQPVQLTMADPTQPGILHYDRFLKNQLPYCKTPVTER
ncbi:MAG: hypothetical protein NPIRA04_26020 [Nitrospirales bacterium]|nr:MAG: hypothetical protein NPIRA04_26020 [Nitrospirales bacterium]